MSTTAPAALLGICVLIISSEVALPAAIQLPGDASHGLNLLTNAAQVRALSCEEAAKAYPVRLIGIVTHATPRHTNGNVVPWEGMNLFLQDDAAGIFVRLVRLRQPAADLRQGLIIEVNGITDLGDYAPMVEAFSYRVLGVEKMPSARAVAFADLASGSLDSAWVEVGGVVRAVRCTPNQPSEIDLQMGNDRLLVWLHTAETKDLDHMVDSEVSIRGVVAGYFNKRRQLVFPQLRVNASSNLVVIKPQPEEDTIPLVSADSLLRFDPKGATAIHRVRTRGVVLWSDSGGTVYLRYDHVAILAQPDGSFASEPGDLVEVLGFPALGVFTTYLQNAVVRKIGRTSPPLPTPMTAAEILDGRSDGDLICLDSELLELVQRPSDWLLVLRSGGTIFNASYTRADADFKANRLRRGSLLHLNGICVVDKSVQPDDQTVKLSRSFCLLLRTRDDIVILKPGPWWTIERSFWAFGCALILGATALAWAWTLRYRVRKQSELIAQKVQREAILEERRRVSREFHDTLQQELIGVKMQVDTVAGTLESSPRVAARTVVIAQQTIRRCLAEFTRSIWGLRIEAIESGYLDEALSKTTELMLAGQPQRCSVQVKGVQRRLSPLVHMHLLRIGQEAVTNAVKHSGADSINIEVNYEPASVSLCVADHGCGFDPTANNHQEPGHFGFEGMRERANKLSGKLAVHSSAGQGTTVEVTVPTERDSGAPTPDKCEFKRGQR